MPARANTSTLTAAPSYTSGLRDSYERAVTVPSDGRVSGVGSRAIHFKG